MKARAAIGRDSSRDALRTLIKGAKSVPCMDCGNSYPSHVMDFDHVRGVKLSGVGVMVSCGSVEKIEAEIAKCDVVCANCHRERTHQRRIMRSRAPVG